MMFPAHNIPRQFAISCVESVCLEVTIISCMDGWTSCSSNLQTPSVSILHVFQTTRHILFRGNEDGAHDNTYFSDREFVLSPLYYR